MHKRLLTLALGVLVWGLGARDSHAGFVPLPTTLDQLLPAGNFTTNSGVDCSFTFDQFVYSTIGGPAANQVNVLAFNAPGPPEEVGLTFQGPFFAGPGTNNDTGLFYHVHGNGVQIVGAFLSGSAFATNSAFVQVVETVFDHTGLNILGQLVIQSGGAHGDAELRSAVRHFHPQGHPTGWQ